MLKSLPFFHTLDGLDVLFQSADVITEGLPFLQTPLPFHFLLLRRGFLSLLQGLHGRKKIKTLTLIKT